MFFSRPTSNFIELLHVCFELTFEPLNRVAEILNLLPQIKVFSGEPGDLVLETRLRVVGWALVDGMIDDL